MPTAFHLRQPAHELRAAARRGTSSPRARPGVVTDMPTPLPTPVVAVGTVCRHRPREKSHEISITYFRASRKLRPRRGLCCFVCVLLFPAKCGAPVGKKDLICDRWCLGPIDLKVDGPSFASEGTTSHGRWSEYKAEGTPASAGARPAASRRRANPPEPFPQSLPPQEPITNTQCPGYRTAQPSDSPPWASRYASRAGTGRVRG